MLRSNGLSRSRLPRERPPDGPEADPPRPAPRAPRPKPSHASPRESGTAESTPHPPNRASAHPVSATSHPRGPGAAKHTVSASSEAYEVAIAILRPGLLFLSGREAMVGGVEEAAVEGRRVTIEGSGFTELNYQWESSFGVGAHKLRDLSCAWQGETVLFIDCQRATDHAEIPQGFQSH